MDGYVYVDYSRWPCRATSRYVCMHSFLYVCIHVIILDGHTVIQAGMYIRMNLDTTLVDTDLVTHTIV